MIKESYNADDQEEIDKARKKAEREHLIRQETIRSLMSKKDGRDWISHILSFCDVHGNPHVAGVPDATAFNAGMANAGKMIWDEVKEATPEFFVKMLVEAQKQ